MLQLPAILLIGVGYEPKHTITTMISEQEIQKRTQELACAINARYKESESLVVMGLLRGSAIF